MHIYLLPVALAFFCMACQSSDADPQNVSQMTETQLFREKQKADSIHDQAIKIEDLKTYETYEAAIKEYRKALALRRKLVLEMDILPDSTKSNLLKGIFRALQNQSNCYVSLGKYEEAYVLQQAAISFLDSLKFYPQNFDWKIERSITAYKAMGKIQQERDNLEEAVRNFQTAATLCEDTASLNKYASRCRDMYVDYSNLYVTWLEADSILRYALKAIATGVNDTNSYQPFMNCGIGYALKKQYAKALQQYDSVRVKNPGQDMGKDFHNRALVYLYNEEFDRAGEYASKAINFNATNLQQRDNLAGNYSLKGDILSGEKKYEAAIGAYDQALSIFMNIPVVELNPTRIINTDPKTIRGKNRMGLLEMLEGKSKLLFSQKKYEAALSWYDVSIGFINHFRKFLPDQSSKIKLAELTKKIFEGTVVTCMALSRKEEAFRFAEQSKSYVLLETVLQMKAVGQLPDVDPTLQEKWKRTQQKIKFLNQKFETQTTSDEQIAIQNEIQLLQKELDQMDSVFQANEKYRKLVTFSPPDIPSIQERMPKNQAFVEYFIGENQSYIFYLLPQGQMEVYPLQIGREALSHKIDSLVQIGIRLPYTMEADIRDDNLRQLKQKLGGHAHAFCDSVYAVYAHELYQLLLAPLQQSARPKPERLMIIPDDVLGYLPFDALLTAAPAKIGQYRSYAYAGKRETGFQIAYAYSAALLKEMQEQEHTLQTDRLLAFAFKGEMTFENQISHLQSLFTKPWDILYRKFKSINSKQELMSSIGEARFLHFATHGKMDDRNSNYSWLLMSENAADKENSLLYLYEIYNLPIHAEMVVTSACETGIGRLHRGEGIISLARGFSAAGASSIVTTLWAVDADKSGNLLEQFYRQLQKGDQKDGALAHAKQEWIQHQDSDWSAKPYFWAGIVPVGDMKAVHLPPQSSGVNSMVFFGVIGLVALGFIAPRIRHSLRVQS